MIFFSRRKKKELRIEDAMSKNSISRLDMDYYCADVKKMFGKRKKVSYKKALSVTQSHKRCNSQLNYEKLN